MDGGSSCHGMNYKVIMQVLFEFSAALDGQRSEYSVSPTGQGWR